MKRKQGQILTAVLVDYDNIYLALRRKNEDAAKRFAKDAALWLKEIESGQLISPTNSVFGNVNRRIVLNRCYGNPVPRRNTHDNSTDMHSFPFVRHHFLRSGFEVVDCPPLTAQLKNSSDIRMVMDIRDFLLHDTYFDEFIILSGDADFTPVLHRLRAHARRTVIFANDHTAVPYKAISDGEVRESDLIQQLIGGSQVALQATAPAAAPLMQIEDQRRAIVGEVLAAVRSSRHAIPLDLLADRVVRLLGHELTAGTNWAGAGSFRELLSQSLPEGFRISDQPPYFVIDAQRKLAETARRAEITSEPLQKLSPSPIVAPAPASAAPLRAEPVAANQRSQQPVATPLASPVPLPAMPATASSALGGQYRSTLPPLGSPAPQPEQPAMRAPAPLAPLAPLPSEQAHLQQQASFTIPPGTFAQEFAQQPVPQAPLVHPQQAELRAQMAIPPPPAPPVPPAPAQQRSPDVASATALQQSIARIHEACQAPPLSPPEYRVLFDVMAREITEGGLAGSQTLANIVQRAQEQGVDVRRDDVRFVLEVVSESDPWFEQGASATLFAGRFRNFVVARCRSQGLHLSVDELDLIEAWFVAGAPAPASAQALQAQAAPAQVGAAQQRSMPPAPPAASADYRTAETVSRSLPPSFSQMFTAPQPPTQQVQGGDEEFPRIVRTRLRG